MRCAGKILYMCPNAVGSNVGATFGGSRLGATGGRGKSPVSFVAFHFCSPHPTPAQFVAPEPVSPPSLCLRRLFTLHFPPGAPTHDSSRATPLLSRLHSTSAQTTLLSPSTDCIQARIVVTHGGSRKRRQGASTTENRSQVVCSIPYLALTPESC